MKNAYYYLYYIIYKTWSKNYNPLLSNNFKADISIIAIKLWFLGVLDTYLSILLNRDATDISISSPKVIITLILVIGSTLYFFTFSDKWKPYFEKFEKLSKRKNLLGNIVVWSLVIFIFINVIISVELARKVNVPRWCWPKLALKASAGLWPVLSMLSNPEMDCPQI